MPEIQPLTEADKSHNQLRPSWLKAGDRIDLFDLLFGALGLWSLLELAAMLLSARLPVYGLIGN